MDNSSRFTFHHKKGPKNPLDILESPEEEQDELKRKLESVRGLFHEEIAKLQLEMEREVGDFLHGHTLLLASKRIPLDIAAPTVREYARKKRETILPQYRAKVQALKNTLKEVEAALQKQ